VNFYVSVIFIFMQERSSGAWPLCSSSECGISYLILLSCLCLVSFSVSRGGFLKEQTKAPVAERRSGGSGKAEGFGARGSSKRLLWSYQGARGAEVKKALPLLRLMLLMFLGNKRKCMSRICMRVSMSGGIMRCRKAEFRFINQE
jgi:hypothetical protein